MHDKIEELLAHTSSHVYAASITVKFSVRNAHTGRLCFVVDVHHHFHVVDAVVNAGGTFFTFTEKLPLQATVCFSVSRLHYLD